MPKVHPTRVPGPRFPDLAWVDRASGWAPHHATVGAPSIPILTCPLGHLSLALRVRHPFASMTMADDTVSAANKRPPPTPGSAKKLAPPSTRPRLLAQGPSTAVIESQRLANLKALVQSMMLSSATLKLRDLNDDVCPLCLALKEGNRLSQAAPPVRHPRPRAPGAQGGGGQVLLRCPELKRGCRNSNGCVICVGGDHYRQDCPLSTHQPYSAHHTCKACSLQIVGSPLTHTAGHTTPDTCDAVGKNFVVEFCLALYRSCPQEMGRLFSEGDNTVPRYWSTGDQRLTDTDLKAFHCWVFSPVWPGAVLSKGLTLTLHCLRSVSVEGSLKPAHTLHLLRWGLSGNLSCFQTLLPSTAI
jgi:hypothetical protein